MGLLSERRNVLTSRLKASAAPKLLTCPTPGITTSFDPGIFVCGSLPTASGDRASSSPCSTSVGRRRDFLADPPDSPPHLAGWQGTGPAGVCPGQGQASGQGWVPGVERQGERAAER